MSKSKVWQSVGQWQACLTLLVWSSLQTPHRVWIRLLPPVCHCSISGYMVEVCHIPCPLDCKLSAWSAWSACSTSCGSGLKMRSKWLREKAFNGGRPCPRLDLKNQVRRAPVLLFITYCKGGHVMEGNCYCNRMLMPIVPFHCMIPSTLPAFFPFSTGKNEFLLPGTW